jgi:hypothetical protein
VLHDEGPQHRAGNGAREDREGCEDDGCRDGPPSARCRTGVLVNAFRSPLYPLVAFFAARTGHPGPGVFLCAR